MGRSRVTFWVERLTLADLPPLLWRCLAGDAVRFDEHRADARAAALLLLAARALPAGAVAPAELSLNDWDAEGQALVYRRCEHLSGAVSSFCAGLADEPDWFRSMVGCFLASHLAERVAFVTMAEARFARYSGERHELYLRRHFCNHVLEAYLRSKGLAVSQSRFSCALLILAAIPLALVSKAVLHGGLGRLFGTAVAAPTRPALWVENAPPQAVWDGFKEMLGGLAPTLGFDVVYYFDRADTRYSVAAAGALAARSLKAQDLRDVSLLGRLRLQDAAPILKAALRPSGGRLWLRLLRAQFEVLWRLYADVFRSRHVKVLIQHQETSWKQQAIARGLEAAGGLMVGLHWSNYEHHDFPSHLTPQHVFFVWGRDHAALLARKGNTCRTILPSGVWMRAEDRTIGPGKPGLRLVVFDSDASYDLYQSPQALARFYAWLLGFLEERRDASVVVKSKLADIEGLALLPRGAELVARLRRLEAEGRAELLGRTGPAPLQAAAGADLSVSFGLNTAGVLAGLLGVPSVHWDCAGWSRYPIYRDPGQKVLYRSLEELDAAVRRFADGDRSIGDFGPFRAPINHFGDFKGFERLMRFIESFIDEAGSRSRDEALEAAVRRYVRDNALDRGWQAEPSRQPS